MPCDVTYRDGCQRFTPKFQVRVSATSGGHRLPGADVSLADAVRRRPPTPGDSQRNRIHSLTATQPPSSTTNLREIRAFWAPLVRRTGKRYLTFVGSR